LPEDDDDARAKVIMGIAGGLVRVGFDAFEINALVWLTAYAAGDRFFEQEAERIAANTVARYRAASRAAPGEVLVRGWRAVGEVVESRVAERARMWLGRAGEAPATVSAAPARLLVAAGNGPTDAAGTVMPAKYESICGACGQPITPGDEIHLKFGSRAVHARCRA
jgi:hypothetical protein